MQLSNRDRDHERLLIPRSHTDVPRSVGPCTCLTPALVNKCIRTVAIQGKHKARNSPWEGLVRYVRTSLMHEVPYTRSVHAIAKKQKGGFCSASIFQPPTSLLVLTSLPLLSLSSFVYSLLVCPFLISAAARAANYVRHPSPSLAASGKARMCCFEATPELPPAAVDNPTTH
jgi:hypothetical protein